MEKERKQRNKYSIREQMNWRKWQANTLFLSKNLKKAAEQAKKIENLKIKRGNESKNYRKKKKEKKKEKAISWVKVCKSEKNM